MVEFTHGPYTRRTAPPRVVGHGDGHKVGPQAPLLLWVCLAVHFAPRQVLQRDKRQGEVPGKPLTEPQRAEVVPKAERRDVQRLAARDAQVASGDRYGSRQPLARSGRPGVAYEAKRPTVFLTQKSPQGCCKYLVNRTMPFSRNMLTKSWYNLLLLVSCGAK